LELTKEDTDLAYQSIILMQYAETDIENAKINMETGHFFRAMDHLNKGKTNLQIGMEDYKKFVQILKDKKFWNAT
jgi:hypothetical protein